MRSWEPGWSSIMLQIDLHFPESFRCLSLGQSKLHNRGCPTHSRTLRKGWVVGSATHSGDENTDWAGNRLPSNRAEVEVDIGRSHNHRKNGQYDHHGSYAGATSLEVSDRHDIPMGQFRLVSMERSFEHPRNERKHVSS